MPIHVGASLSDKYFGIQRDDELNGNRTENISSKNKSYCELTALYWAWKNIEKLFPGIQYVGLNHYRRYFTNKNSFCDTIKYPESAIQSYSFDTEYIKKILTKNDAIIAKKRIFPYSVRIQYCKAHFSDDFSILEQVLKEKFPDYAESFEAVCDKNNKISFYNMFIFQTETFYHYCEWLFTILEEVERRIPIEHYSNVQQRIFGYMAERLLNVFIYKNKMKCKELPVVCFSDSMENASLKAHLVNKLNYANAFRISQNRTVIHFLLSLFKFKNHKEK